jgi:hypothetical protein
MSGNPHKAEPFFAPWPPALPSSWSNRPGPPLTLEGIRRAQAALRALRPIEPPMAFVPVWHPLAKPAKSPPRLNGVRVVHGRAGEVLGGPVVGPRWLITERLEPIRVRTCKGKRS